MTKQDLLKSFLAFVLLLGLVLVSGLPRQPAGMSADSCGLKHLEIPSDILQATPSNSVESKASEQVDSNTWRIIDTIVILPSEYSIDPLSGQPIGKNRRELELEIRAVIAHVNQYLAPLRLIVRVTKFKIYLPGEHDPYSQAALNGDSVQMLETAVSNQENYPDSGYDLVLLLGRGYYSGSFGVSYPGVSCTAQKYSIVFATLGGYGIYREYSLAHTVAHEIGHYLGMRHDSNEYTEGRSLMWPSFVQEPFGFSQRSISHALSRIAPGLKGGECFAITDSYLDIVSDDPTTVLPTSDSEEDSVYALWNSFLGTVNIIEMINPSFDDINVIVELYSIDGRKVFSERGTVAAHTQFDLIINELPGFAENSYGLLRVDSDGPLKGRASYYKKPKESQKHEFAFSIPFLRPSRGKTAVGFNTYQPSMHPLELDNQVTNWLTIVNLSERESVFRVNSFDHRGAILRTATVVVPENGRVDIDGGHGFAGPGVVGLHEIIPEFKALPYKVILNRYGTNAPPGETASRYHFAYPLLASLGTVDSQYLPVSKLDSKDTWIEIGNASSLPLNVGFELFSAEGTIIANYPVALRAHEQRHINATQLIDKNEFEFAYAKLRPDVSDALISNGTYYYRDTSTGGVYLMAGISGRTPATQLPIVGSYNLFLGTQNLLRLSNITSSSVSATVTLGLREGESAHEISLSAHSSIILNLHDFARYGTSKNSYGPVFINTDTPLSLFAGILRQRWSEKGLDLLIPTELY